MVPVLDMGAFTGCVDWRKWAVQQIETLRPALVVVASDLPPAMVKEGHTVDDTGAMIDAFRNGLAETIDQIQPSAGRVVVIGDVPGMSERPGDCLSVRGARLDDCLSRPSERSHLIFAATREVAADTGAEFVNPLPWFCYRGLCPAVVGATVTYRDLEHITTAYARRLATPLRVAMGIDETRSTDGG
jgi:hypothetical protein